MSREQLKGIFRSVPFIVDVDDSYGHPRPRLRIAIDQDRLEFFGVEQSDVYDTIEALFGGVPVGYSYRGEDRFPLDIVVGLPQRDLSWSEQLAATPVPANALPGNRGIVELGEVVRATPEQGSRVLFRRDGHFADMVMAELAGRFEAPIYGMIAVEQAIAAHDWGKLGAPPVSLRGQPADESQPSILWDGEWEITYVTFRDMGLAFGVALLGIYILVVAQFGSFRLPLVVLTPVPLTLIGIVLGHWAFGAPFTATSMIGFIALAGIIVRNSILLVDFIRHVPQAGLTLSRSGADRRRDPLQADPADRAFGDDRCGHHPDRSDLPGAGDLAAVRAGVIDVAHRAGDPGDLRGAARRRDRAHPASRSGEVIGRNPPRVPCLLMTTRSRRRYAMERPLEIAFHGIDASAEIEAEIRRHVEKLERRFPRLVGCRVSVETKHRQHQVGNVPEVHILLMVPGRDLAVSHEPGGRDRPAVPELMGSVRDAFNAAERQLESHKWEPREDMTAPTAHALAGTVSLIEPGADHGFLLTPERHAALFPPRQRHQRPLRGFARGRPRALCRGGERIPVRWRTRCALRHSGASSGLPPPRARAPCASFPRPATAA